MNDFDVEATRIASAFGDVDLEALKTRPIWCCIGRHEVDPVRVRTTPKGLSVCYECARTPAGQAELRGRDRLDGYRRLK